jgi:hypothetical protein
MVRKTIQALTGETLEFSAKGQALVKAPVKEKITLKTVVGSDVADALARFHWVKRTNA